jgi:hypothetical protein
MTIFVNGVDISGGGGASLPDDPASVLLDAAAPSTLVGLDAAGIGTALSAEAAADFVRQTAQIAGSAFTASAGLGTAVASTLTMTIATTATTWADLPRLMRNHGGDPWNIDFSARVTVTGGNGDTYVPLTIRNAAGDGLVLVQARGSDGQVTVYDSGLLATSGVALPLDGTGALRIVLSNAWLTVYQSEDSGEHWRPIYRGTVAIPSTAPWAYTYVGSYLFQGSAPGGTVTASLADVLLAVPL